MAGASLLALLDDIATILEDVGTLTKVATEKTAGVLGDDLALNAQQVGGVDPERELPVVWAVAKGSALNKLILVPLALAISWAAPWLVTPLLMFGGVFLCYEGAHKLLETFTKSREDVKAEHQELIVQLADPSIDLVQAEAEQIKGAIRTDFVLSAEIVAITLGTVADADIGTRIIVLSAIAALMTVGVYGLVAGIVKLDDIGASLAKRSGRAARAMGGFLLAFAPKFMRFLAVAGTIAMFIVGGGILVHGLSSVIDLAEHITPHAGGLGWLVMPVANATFGLAAGLVACLLLWLAALVGGTRRT